MKLIAHRGLINGPDKKLENNPKHIEYALALGYDVEVDVNFLPRLGFMLGHDKPLYQVTYEWLSQPGLWLHAKDAESLRRLTNLNVFWHQDDDYTITSKGYVWTVKGETSDKTVICMPEWTYELDSLKHFDCYGVCSDYVKEIRNML